MTLPLESLLCLPAHNITLEAAIPPVPPKLVAKIEAGEFIDLLSDHAGNTRPDDPGKVLSKQRTVSGILEWMKCFNVCMAIISCKQSARIPDLLA